MSEDASAASSDQSGTESSFETVTTRADLAAGKVCHVELSDGTPVCVGRVGEEFFAIGGICPHAGAPLGEGALEGHSVICPWHGLPFDMRTGKGEGALAYQDVDPFDVRVDGEDVQVRKKSA